MNDAAKIKMLREALAKFAPLLSNIQRKHYSSGNNGGRFNTWIRIEDLEAARAALKATQPQPVHVEEFHPGEWVAWRGDWDEADDCKMRTGRGSTPEEAKESLLEAEA